MAGLKQWVVGTLIVVLFGIVLVNFMAEFIGLNNPSSTALSSPLINSSLNSLNQQTDTFTQSSSDLITTISEDEPTPISSWAFLIFKSAFYALISIPAIIITSTGVLLSLPFAIIFGPGASDFYIVFDIIVAIIMFILGFYIIKAIRTGDSG